MFSRMSFLAFRGIIRGGGSVDMSASYPGGQTPSSSLGESGHRKYWTRRAIKEWLRQCFARLVGAGSLDAGILL